MDRKSFGIGVFGGLGALALAVLPGQAGAQEAETRLGWQPYLGCWAQPAHIVDVDRPEGEEAAQGVLCFVASGSDVDMLTIVDGEITHREPFPADGQPRTVEQDGCRGTETARFSDDRRRIYTTSEVTCEDGALRTSTGIISMPGFSEWLDVRAMEVDGRATAWSQWYQRTGTDALDDLGIESGQFETPLAVRGASMYAAARIMVDDVIDASRNAHPKAVEAWVAEVGQPFAGLDAEQLVRLADAGVPGGVIDVVVAVSFPTRFALNRQDAYAERGDDIRPRTVWLRPGYGYDPYYDYGYFNRYGRFGSYYSPYGYFGGYGWGGGGYGWGRGYYTPVIVNVTPTDRQGGRVVAGRGYRGPRSTGTTGGAWMGGSGAYRGSGGAVSSGGSGGGSRSAKPRGSSGSSSKPSVSSTSGRSGSSTGRTARRRGGSG